MCTSSPGSKLDITLTNLPRPHQDDQKKFLRKSTSVLEHCQKLKGQERT